MKLIVTEWNGGQQRLEVREGGDIDKRYKLTYKMNRFWRPNIRTVTTVNEMYCILEIC